jgi:hypothetical protein
MMNHSRCLIPILFVIHLGLLFSCAKKTPTAPCIVFNDTICHLSLSKDNLRDSFDFVYRNTGDRKLVVYSVDPSCHCLTATFEQIMLAKGDSSFIRIYFDATNEGGTDFWRTLDVYTNARKEPYTLEVFGTME